MLSAENTAREHIPHNLTSSNIAWKSGALLRARGRGSLQSGHRIFLGQPLSMISDQPKALIDIIINVNIDLTALTY